MKSTLIIVILTVLLGGYYFSSNSKTDIVIAKYSDEEIEFDSFNQIPLDNLQDIKHKIYPENNTDDTNDTVSNVEPNLEIELREKLESNDFSTEESVLLVERLQAIKRADPNNTSVEKYLNTEDLALIELKNISPEKLHQMSLSEREKLINENGGRDWLQSYYVKTIVQGHNIEPLSEEEIEELKEKYQDENSTRTREINYE